MKQHITREQWEEIDQKRKLFFQRSIDFCSKGECDDYPDCDYGIGMPDIGQMIEFLTKGLTQNAYIDDTFRHVMQIETGSERIEIGWTNYCGKSEELCDALWEAVKDKLRKLSGKTLHKK